MDVENQKLQNMIYEVTTKKREIPALTFTMEEYTYTPLEGHSTL